MSETKIEWTDTTWNPVRGCSIVSAGCTNCYAMKQAHRFSGPGGPYEGLTTVTRGGPVWTGDVRIVPELLDAPLRWRKPRRVFVNSMSDLFHDAIPDTFIDRVFAVMAMSDQHRFQILTKRPERMQRYLTSRGDRPLANVWLGVSIENQATADERIPLLLQTLAAVRFVSCEPLLGPIELPAHDQSMGQSYSPLDWVIVGGESGPGARPCDVRWIRSVVGHCKATRVPVFVKQLGAKYQDAHNGIAGSHYRYDRPTQMQIHNREIGALMYLRSRKGGDPSEWPADLRVREFPK